jgi:hypothetical protein
VLDDDLADPAPVPEWRDVPVTCRRCGYLLARLAREDTPPRGITVWGLFPAIGSNAAPHPGKAMTLVCLRCKRHITAKASTLGAIVDRAPETTSVVTV